MPLEARGLSKPLQPILSSSFRLGAVREMSCAPSGPCISCTSLLLPPTAFL